MAITITPGTPVVPDEFTDLTDVPASYTGEAGKLVAVNGTEDALEFVAGSGGAVDSVNGQTGVVVLDTDDVDEGATNLYATEASVGAIVNAAAAATPVAADKFSFWDTANSLLKSITWTNLLAAIHTATHLLQNKTIDSTNMLDASYESMDFNANAIVLLADGNDGFTIKGIEQSSFLEDLAGGGVVLTSGAQTIAGVKTFSDEVIAHTVRRATETSSTTIMGGTSVTEGPYIKLTGKDVGGAEDGEIIYVATSESGGVGLHSFYVYDGVSATLKARITSAGLIVGGTDALSLFDEGTYTPVLTGSGGNPTVTYSEQAGIYQRTNNKIEFQATLRIATISGGSGLARISVPFTIAASPSRQLLTAMFIHTGGSVVVNGTGYIAASTANAFIYNQPASFNPVAISNLAANDYLSIGGVIFL